MKLLIALSIIYMSIVGMHLRKVDIYGDVVNYEYLGVEVAFVTPEPGTIAIESVTFPDDIVDNNFRIWGVKHYDFERYPSNVTFSNGFGSKSITIKIQSDTGSAISSTFYFYGRKLYSLENRS